MLDPKLLMLLSVGMLLLVNGIIDIGRRRAQGAPGSAWEGGDEALPDGRGSVEVARVSVEVGRTSVHVDEPL